MSISNEEREILNAIQKNDNVLIIGAGGVGKSTFLRYIYLLLQDVKCCVLSATTGVAALNISGMTLHRFAGIGLGTDDKDVLLKKVMNNKKTITRLKGTDILFIDEVSMLGAELLDKLNFIFQNVRGNKRPMGGMQLVLCGDFLQLPPIRDKFLFEYSDYKSLNIKRFELTKLKRFTDKAYSELLSRFRVGKPTESDIDILRSRYEKYKEIENDIKNWEIRPTKIYSKKVDVEYENMIELEKIDEDEYNFEATDSLTGGNEMQLEYLVTELNNNIPKNISLKKGAQVMLRKNIDVENGLVNGSRGVVLQIFEESMNVLVKFKNGITAIIDFEKWEAKDRKAKTKVIREQIPLILAYAITIHKSQGTTLDFCICDLGLSVFEDAQAYVALSRNRSLEGLYLSDFDESCVRSNKKALEFLEKL